MYMMVVVSLCPSESNHQEDLFEQILEGRLEYPSPYWDLISHSVKVRTTDTHTHTHTHIDTDTCIHRLSPTLFHSLTLSHRHTSQHWG